MDYNLPRKVDVMRILIYSDIHIHKHKRDSERLLDCLKVQEWVFQTAHERNIQNIFFCGDLFHERQIIDVETYQKTFEIFEKYDKFNVYLLLGNHDMYHKKLWNISSMMPLQVIPGVTIINNPCTLDIGDYSLSFLPYTDNPIGDLRELKNKSKFKVLFSHLALDNAILNKFANNFSVESVERDGDMVKVDTDILQGWDQVFLGHYHYAQELNEHVEYVGSPLQLSFGEAFSEKHIIEYDLESHEKNYIENTFSPKHYILKSDELDNYDLENNFVRMYTDDLTSTDIAEIRNSIIEDKHVNSIEVLSTPGKSNKNEIMDAKTVLNRQGDMIEQYVEVEKSAGRINDNLDLQLLIDIGKKILERNS